MITGSFKKVKFTASIQEAPKEETKRNLLVFEKETGETFQLLFRKPMSHDTIETIVSNIFKLVTLKSFNVTDSETTNSENVQFATELKNGIYSFFNVKTAKYNDLLMESTND